MHYIILILTIVVISFNPCGEITAQDHTKKEQKEETIHIGGIKILKSIPLSDGQEIGSNIEILCDIDVTANGSQKIRDAIENEIRSNSKIHDLITEQTIKTYAEDQFPKSGFLNSYSRNPLIKKLKKAYPEHFRKELDNYYMTMTLGILDPKKRKKSVSIEHKEINSVSVADALSMMPNGEFLVFIGFGKMSESYQKTAKK